jgi:catechol 2,3-dioxygenase-like lactoylglutathione lyase family enzyme
MKQPMDLLINIDVDDLSKAIAFYHEAAGLRLGRRFGALGAEMLGASSAICLLVKPDGTKPSTTTDDVRRYRRHWTPVHLDFVVSGRAAPLMRYFCMRVTPNRQLDLPSAGCGP